MAYPKQYLVTMDPNIAGENLSLNHGTSYKGLPVPFSLRVTNFQSKLSIPLRKSYENAKKMIVTHTQLCYHYAQPKTALVHPLRVVDKMKVANTSTLAKRKRKHQHKAQETNNEPIRRSLTIEFKQNGPLSPEKQLYMNWNYSKQQQHVSTLNIVKRRVQCNSKKQTPLQKDKLKFC